MVREAAIDEATAGDPAAAAVENARRKAIVVAEAGEDGALVLGADTIVSIDGRLLPKPRDEDQARGWLELLSDRSHEVIGGLCVVQGGRARETSVRSRVEFRALRRAEIDWYLASGEWRERAGGYAIQGRGAALVSRLEGDYLNVVGLSVAGLLELVPDLIARAAPRT